MKKLLVLMLGFACVGLEATHFQSSLFVTPISDQSKFLVEVQIEKLADGSSIPELVASPKMICTPGEPNQLTIGSEDQADFLSIQVTIPKNTSQESLQTSIFMKENNQIILSSNHLIKVN